MAKKADDIGPLVQPCAQFAPGPAMLETEKRLLSVQLIFFRTLLDKLRHRHFILRLPLAPEEMIPLDLLVPEWFIRLAPDLLPLGRRVMAEEVLVAQGFVLEKLRCKIVVISADDVVVARDEQFHRSAMLAEHLAPCIGMELNGCRHPPVRKVTAMDNGIDVCSLEIFKCRPEVFNRETPTRFLSAPVCSDMRIRDNAKNEIRPPGRLPSSGRGKSDSARQRRESQRRQSPFQKFASCHIGRIHFRPFTFTWCFHGLFLLFVIDDTVLIRLLLIPQKPCPKVGPTVVGPRNRL